MEERMSGASNGPERRNVRESTQQPLNNLEDSAAIRIQLSSFPVRVERNRVPCLLPSLVDGRPSSRGAVEDGLRSTAEVIAGWPRGERRSWTGVMSARPVGSTRGCLRCPERQQRIAGQDITQLGTSKQDGSQWQREPPLSVRSSRPERLARERLHESGTQSGFYQQCGVHTDTAGAWLQALSGGTPEETGGGSPLDGWVMDVSKKRTRFARFWRLESTTDKLSNLSVGANRPKQRLNGPPKILRGMRSRMAVTAARAAVDGLRLCAALCCTPAAAAGRVCVCGWQGCSCRVRLQGGWDRLGC